MEKLYRKLLSILVRRELRQMPSYYPITLDDLITYHDFMAIEAMNNPRLLGVSVQSAMYLSKMKELQGDHNDRIYGNT